ncbi:lysophospholipid acyltransferase family protein [Desulfogranum marinum]|uniref:lysophospholipid acyltransferase family protein n=1 Tax=Desulfogranum marinum TaxID=453220 RepID=UPI0029C757D8|nr:lysophospholipid acyltransferase family protein [Desulfogranum marinum]
MADFWYRISVRVVPRIFVGLTKVWFGTCRVRVTGTEHLEKCAAARAAVAVFWHYSFAYLFYYLRKFPAAAMVSASRDGEYIAEVARLMGHIPVRGSSNRFGIRALRALIAEVQRGHNAAIVADGSQGPARKAQAGCILVASKSGAPILPIVWSASRYFAFKSWDRTVVPLPFSTIFVRYGEPVSIPADIKGEQVEEYRQMLEKQLNDLYDLAWGETGQHSHDGKETPSS